MAIFRARSFYLNRVKWPSVGLKVGAGWGPPMGMKKGLQS